MVLCELVSTLRVRATSSARALGLAREHAPITARHGRVNTAWAPHLEASRQAILVAVSKCPRRESVLVIGAGSCLDVPVAQLAHEFNRVLLADVVLSPVARRWARRSDGKVEAMSWDATGVLETLARQRRSLTAREAEALFGSGVPGLPDSIQPDLVVSANCLSQLGLVPAGALLATRHDPLLPQRCALAAATAHLRWRANNSGVRILLADIARLDVAPDGNILLREELLGGLPLPPPVRTWRWDLAPIPEWSASCHRVHEVGVWSWGT